MTTVTTATDTGIHPPIITGTYYEARPGLWGLRDTYYIKKRKGSFYMEVLAAKPAPATSSPGWTRRKRRG